MKSCYLVEIRLRSHYYCCIGEIQLGQNISPTQGGEQRIPCLTNLHTRLTYTPAFKVHADYFFKKK